jgi:hypothetical protein
VLVSFVLTLLVVVVAHAIVRYRRNAYRRAALAELVNLTNMSGNTLTRLSELLKRTALAAYPREEIASLTGAAWVDWLSETSGLTISGAARNALAHGAYRETVSDDVRLAVDVADRWIRKHRADGTARSSREEK